MAIPENDTTTNTADVNGTRLTYVTDGRGAPVLFVHGSLGDYRSWEPQRAAVARDYQFVSYSRRYHFPNRFEAGGPAYTYATHVDDLVELIDHLHLDRVHLVGHSYGGVLAIMLALHQPERVRTLILAEPQIPSLLSDKPEERGLAEERKRAMSEVEERAESGKTTDLPRRFMDLVNGYTGAFDAFDDQTRAVMLTNANTLPPMLLTPDVFELTCEDVASVTSPVLILTSERATPLNVAENRTLAQCLPKATERVVPGASHAMSSQNSAEFNRLLLEFLLCES